MQLPKMIYFYQSLTQFSIFGRFVLEAHDSSGFSDLGPVVGRNGLALVLVWLLVYYCCMRGIQHLAKVRVVNKLGGNVINVR